MTCDEIKLLAKSVGLDPDRLVIFEPFYDGALQAMRYRLEYYEGQKILDWNFLIQRQDVEESAVAAESLIRLHTEGGLRELRELVLKGPRV